MTVVVAPRRVVSPGTVDTSRPHCTLSRLVEGAAVPFGRPVVQGSGDRSVRLLGGTAAPFVGIAVPGENPFGPDHTLTAGAYQPGTWAAVLTAGTVWIEVAAAVLPNVPVYFDAASGGLGTVPGNGRVQLPRAAFQGSALAGDVALLSL